MNSTDASSGITGDIETAYIHAMSAFPLYGGSVHKKRAFTYG